MFRNIRLLFVAAVIFTTTATCAHADPGDLDASYGTNGMVNALGEIGLTVVDAQLDAQDRIVGLATGRSLDSDTDYRAALVRLRSDGSLDPTFGDGGFVSLLPDGFTTFFPGGIQIQEDGKLVVLGSAETRNPEQGSTIVTRLHPDGAIDTEFGIGGLARLQAEPGFVFSGQRLVIETEGYTILGSKQTSDVAELALMRLTRAGSPILNPGGDGIVEFAIPGYDWSYFTDVISDGTSLIAVGIARTGRVLEDRGFAIRITGDGSLDESFANGEGVLFSPDHPNGGEQFLGAELGADGQLYFVGSHPQGGLLVRASVDGVLDPSFGTGGARVDFGAADFSDIAESTTGRMYLTGTRASRVAVYAIRSSDGARDFRFSEDGLAAGPAGAGLRIAVESSGRPIAVSQWSDPLSSSRYLTATRFIGVDDLSAPTIAIDSPTDTQRVLRNTPLSSSYSCFDEVGGSGIATCDGTVSNGSAVDTSTVGTHMFTVVAVDNAGNRTERTHEYTVYADVEAPTIELRVPGADLQVEIDQELVADYSCIDEVGGSGLVSCTGTAPSGAAVDTSTPGVHEFTVVAIDAAGNSRSTTNSYEVVTGDCAEVVPGPNGLPIPCPIVSDGSGADIDVQADPTRIRTNWTPVSHSSGIAAYQWCVGTAENPCAVLDWRTVGGTTTSAQRPKLNLVDGERYIVCVRALSNSGAMSDPGCSDGVTIDTAGPGSVVDVRDGSGTSDEDTFREGVPLSASWSLPPVGTERAQSVQWCVTRTSTCRDGENGGWSSGSPITTTSTIVDFDALDAPIANHYRFCVRLVTQLGLAGSAVCSDGVSIERNWVDLTSDRTEVAWGDRATLTATTDIDATTQHPIQIVNTTLGTLEKSCDTGRSCRFLASMQGAGTHQYRAYVGRVNGGIPTSYRAQSAPVTLSQRSFELELDVSDAEITSNETATLTATLNQPIDGSPWNIVIANETTGWPIASCSTGTVCSAVVHPDDLDSDIFVAYVAMGGTYPGVDVQAVSNRVMVALAPYVIALASSAYEITTADSATLTAITNQDLIGSASIVIRNETTSQTVAICGSGGVCSWAGARREVNGADRYRAYVALDPNDPHGSSLAQSNDVVVSLLPFDIELTTDATVITTDESATLTATANQATTTSAWIVIRNETTGELVAGCLAARECSAMVTRDRNGVDRFVAYIVTDPGRLEDAQAQSAVVGVTLMPIAVSLFITDSVVEAGEYATLIATPNQTLTSMWLIIWNETTDEFVASCYQARECLASIMKREVGAHHFRAFVITDPNVPPAPSSVQTTSSNEVTLSLQTLTVDLEYDYLPGQRAEAACSGNETPPCLRLFGLFTGTARTNQDLTHTPYFLEIWVDGHRVAQCKGGLVCYVEEIETGFRASRIVAVIALGDLIIASSDENSDPQRLRGPMGGIETSGGSNPSEACPQRCVADPVNTASGEFFLNRSDISIPGRGVDLNFERTYSTHRATQQTTLGFGWRHSYEMEVKPDPTDPYQTLVVQENGSVLTFDRLTDDHEDPYFVAPRRVRASLEYVPSTGGYRLVRNRQETFTFNADGQLIGIEDLNGYETTVERDLLGRIARVVDPSDRTLEFEYLDGRLQSVEGPEGLYVQFGYSGSGDLSSVTDANEDVERYDYTTDHLLDELTDPRGYTTTNQYDATGRVEVQTDALTRRTRFAYAVVDRDVETTITYPSGRQVRHEYVNGMLMSETKALGTPVQSTTQYAYDARTNNVTMVKDGNGGAWTYAYDVSGNRVRATDPLGRTRRWTYTASNKVSSVTNERGITTTIEYDGRQNPVSVSTPLRPDGPMVTSTTEYDDAFPGDALIVRDPTGVETHLAWDENGFPASVTDAAGNTTRYLFNDAGWLTEMVSAEGNVHGADADRYRTHFEHDGVGRVERVTDPLGRSTRRVHDPAGNVIESIASNGSVTSMQYDEAGQLRKIVEPGKTDATTKLEYTYTPDGELRTRSDGAGGVHEYEYDAAQDLRRVFDPRRRAVEFDYDLSGRLKTRRDANLTATRYVYDPAGQLKRIDYGDGETTDATFEYDAGGRRVGYTDATGTTRIEYDDLDRIIRTVNGDGAVVGYELDLAGRVERLQYPDADRAVDYGYDTAGRMDRVTDWLDGETRFTYDNNGLLDRIIRPNGVDTDVTRNEVGQPTSIAHRRSVSDVATFAYTYDGAGLMESAVDGGEIGVASEQYAYDAMGQLERVVGGIAPGAFDFDDAHNLVLRSGDETLDYDPARQLISSRTGSEDPSSFVFSARGERLSQTRGGATTRFAYDAEQRLTSFTAADGAVTQYSYDALGLRQSATATNHSRQFVWSASALPMLLSDTDRHYIYGPGGMPLEEIRSDGSVRYLHADQLRSIRAITDVDGDLVGSAKYDVYGVATSTGDSSRLGFAGEYTDPESGLQYLRARYYDPATVQFLTRDPIEDLTGDPYGYADGNPIMNTDPTGLWSWSQFGSDLAHNTMSTANGIANAVTFGLTGKYQEAIGYCADTDSASYKIGYGSGFAASMLLTGLGRGTATAANWELTAASSGTKITRQMGTRGWTRESVDEAVRFGQRHAATDTRWGRNIAATRYVHPSTGQSVTINRYGEVVQVGGPGFIF